MTLNLNQRQETETLQHVVSFHLMDVLISGTWHCIENRLIKEVFMSGVGCFFSDCVEERKGSYGTICEVIQMF